MDNGLHAALTEGQFYFDVDVDVEVQAIGFVGVELVVALNQRAYPDDVLRQKVRDYLEEHGKFIGSGGENRLSARRLALWRELNDLTMGETATRLEGLILDAQTLYGVVRQALASAEAIGIK